MSKGSDSTSSSTRTFMPKPEEKAPKKTVKLPKPKRPTIAVSPAPLIILVLLAFSIFMVVQYHDAKQNIQTGNPANTNKQASDTIGKVQKLAAVPTNETPTVAPITDITKLSSQAFFARARNGDVVLVYGKAKEAVLYRPSTNQIVTISNVTVSSPSQ